MFYESCVDVASRSTKLFNVTNTANLSGRRSVECRSVGEVNSSRRSSAKVDALGNANYIYSLRNLKSRVQIKKAKLSLSKIFYSYHRDNL